MDKNVENFDSNKVGIKARMRETNSEYAGNFGVHLETLTGEKSNKCNQCSYASTQAGNLKRHLKTHSGEMAKQCNQCQYTSIRANSFYQKKSI